MRVDRRGAVVLDREFMHGYGPRLPGCALGQSTSSVGALSRPRSEWYLDEQRLFVCLNSYQRRDGSRGCMFPRKLRWYWIGQVPSPGKIDVRRIERLFNVVL